MTSFIKKILRLHSNIICKNIVKIFQKFKVGYTQTSTFLKVIQYDISKGSL